MAILEILIYPDSRLRDKTKPLTAVTDEVRKLLDDMAETMYQAPGLGLAAPQVGSRMRVCVVDVSHDEEKGKPGELYKLVNPVIVARAGETEYEEGCLSIPGLRELVRRDERVTVQALNEHGSPVTIEADGILAICLQHEIDHLDGVLFIDRLSTIKREMLRSKLKKLAKTGKLEDD